MDGGHWENIFVNGSNWELVDVDGSDGQVVTLGLESVLIGDPGQSEFLALGGDPVGRSLVGVAVSILVRVGGVRFAVRVSGINDLGGELLLGLGLFAGGVVGSSVAIKSLSVTLVGLSSFQTYENDR